MIIEKICDERLFNSSFIGIALVDAAGAVIRFNNKMCELTGYSDEELKGILIATCLHPDYADSLLSFFKPVSGVVFDDAVFFVKFRKKDGAYIECVLNLFSISDKEGSNAGHVLYFNARTGDDAAQRQVNAGSDMQWIDIEDKDRKEEFLCNIFHGIQDSVLITDAGGVILSYNMKMLKLLGLNMEEMASFANLADISAEDLNIKIAEKFIRGAFDGADQQFTWQLKKPADDTIIDVEIFATSISKVGEDVLLITIKDITDKKRIEDELKNSETRYRLLVEHSPDGIIIHKKGVIKYVNPAGAVLLGGGQAEDILGRPVLQFFKENVHGVIRKRLKDLYDYKRSMPLEEGEMIRLDGQVINVEFASMPFELEGATAVQVVLRDITEKKKQDKYIRYLAMHDRLTGLPNRELLTDRISKGTARQKRGNLKNAVIYIDLDGFKPINDTLGHDAGDEALREIAVRLDKSVRGSDTVSRIGGDEFAVFLEGVAGKKEISRVADRILDSLNKPISINDHLFHVGASMGISIYPDDTVNLGELITFADKAMYYVKETGKNRYTYYSDVPAGV
ncbi:diguanylate cyclase with PAS/PAC sensor [Denitrovibrio acetiphilus DSM 12809]|uniref:Diguanylate cyclase with PAS/PAC sensor n=1 Tax=Denitrovibrio acetiphilus (strain DSM 12809 / NBRC 114555 / N2460) TaxID=522772 RepID=D4H412_DENA2|nr:sensor domain-containing diguanylate cyclase [Denitrovibrio acetiphilus]ADD67323.1 diguanylate cyclase with PAS/PAC sensor [Denitrovibrio acetiphilus DSM 12809]